MNISSMGATGNAWATAGLQRGAAPGSTGSTGRAQGADSAQRMEALFAQIDSDSDGSISQSEFEAFKPPEAPSSPSEFNVQRSTSEFAQQGGMQGPHGAGGPPPGPPPSLSEKDSDDDGSISAEEFGISSDSTATQDAQATELFSTIDSDGSGELSTEEVEAFESMMAEQRTQGPGGPPPPGMGGDDPLAALDSDDDGSVSAGEFGLEDATAQMQQLFDAIDSDDDGALGSAEIQDFQAQMMALQAQQYDQVASAGSGASLGSGVSTTA